MIRILIVDDHVSPEFIDDMKREIGERFDNAEVQTLHVNPVNELDSGGPRESLAAFLGQIEIIGSQFWDVVIIDLNLADVKHLPDEERIQLPISIAQAFRESNHCGTVILYSGTLADHIDNLLKGQLPAEAALKRIFHAEIANFFPRRRIAAEVLSAIDNPSWLLRVDRLLMKYESLVVGPEEAEFKGRKFEDLARAVRRQDRDGQKIAQLTAEYGISCFADLNSQ